MFKSLQAFPLETLSRPDVHTARVKFSIVPAKNFELDFGVQSFEWLDVWIFVTVIMVPCERNTLQQPIEKLSGTDRVNVASGYVHMEFTRHRTEKVCCSHGTTLTD